MAHALSVRDDLPTGTVTFLFTDIEGSTRLLDEIGAAAYADALADHRRIVREVCSSCSGVEVDTQGDAFFLAFGRAPDALAAAELITERLHDGPIRVRIGVYTGTPLLTDEGYVGADVHRAARIAAAGHGGQVLVSSSTATLADVPLRDLGEHRFKDLAAPERVFQLGDAGFPPLKSLYRSNLPVPATPFLGRETELKAVVGLLTAPGARLVSLIGPGGTGKTRLGLQAAAEVSGDYPGGVFWAALAPLREPALVLPAVAVAVGVSEGSAGSAVDDLARGLAGRRLLVFLDNVEHLLPAAADAIGDFVAACPTVTTVVTSRERLQLPGERVYAVPPMTTSDGEALFRSRAADAGASVEASEVVRALCARLDDLPLALELAAARMAVFSPAQLLERLSRHLDVLKGGRGVDARQATLRATIAWSHDLLDPDERSLFRRMSVFVGGCSLESAEQVVGADPDTVQSVLDKSLLRRTDGRGGPRFWMLETIREFAAEQLVATGERAALERRHLEHYAALLDEAFDETLRGHDDLGPLGEERNNLRSALDVALRTDPELALEMAPKLARSWIHAGTLREGQEWIAAAIAAVPNASLGARAAALYGAGLLAHYQADLEVGDRVATEALALFRELGDQRGIAGTLGMLGFVSHLRGDPRGASRLFEASATAFAQIGDEESRLVELGFLATAVHDAGDPARAIALHREGVAGLRRDGTPLRLAYALANLASAEELAGNTEQAKRSFEESLALSRQIQHRTGIAVSLLGLGYRSRATDPAAAFAHLRESLQLFREIEDPRGIGYCLLAGSIASMHGGDATAAVTLLGASAATHGQIGLTIAPYEQVERDEVEARCRTALSSEAFMHAWDQGAAMDANAAADWALSSWQIPSPSPS
jgi:predicted ATPase/class 3 adenylate cyclase